MAKRENRERRKSNFKKILIIILSIIIIAIIGLMILINIMTKVDTSKTRLIINNNNVTERLKNNVIIEDKTIYLSMQDIKNFLDPYIYMEDEVDKIITTSGNKIAEIGFDNKYITINGAKKEIYATAKKEDEDIYLPISELDDIYNVDIKYNDEYNLVTVDSLDTEYISADILKNTYVKNQGKFLSKISAKVKRGDNVVIISDKGNGWTKIRCENGIMGYVKTKKVTNILKIRENMDTKKQNEKISLFWDYFSQYAKAPDRTSEKIEGVNVVSPSFFYIDKDGTFKENVNTEGKSYIDWAHSNDMKVWPMVSNSEGGIKITSKILNSYKLRKELIENIVKVCTEYDLDGINIDFENMYQDDKELFSRFIIELTPRLNDLGKTVSVDVTAPDGSETWSLCYNRNLLGKIADYLIFMAYDQYGVSSDKAGTTAGYNWVETNIKKFVGIQEEVDSNKLILGIPFYTKIWTITADGEVSCKTVNMKDIDNVIPKDATRTWDDDLKQNVVEYKSGNNTKKMWIEDMESIKYKLSLISEYDLAGVACWEKDRENEEVWSLINENLK